MFAFCRLGIQVPRGKRFALLSWVVSDRFEQALSWLTVNSLILHIWLSSAPPARFWKLNIICFSKKTAGLINALY